MKPAERKLAAQLSEGSPGVALGLDAEAAIQLRRDVLAVLERCVELRGVSDLFARTSALAKDQNVAFENILEVFYSLLTDLLDLSCSTSLGAVRNPALRKELEGLSKKVDLSWIVRAVGGLTRSTPGCGATLTAPWAWTRSLFLWPGPCRKLEI